MGNPEARILVVEPHQHTRVMLTELLASKGFTPMPAASGQEAIQRTAAVHPELILLEMKLPDEDGLAVCRTLCKQNPQTPLIVLTEIVDSQTRLDAISCGAVDYLTKPYNRDYLLAKIKSLLAVLFSGKRSVPNHPLDDLFAKDPILRPEPSSDSPFGYTYPQLATALGLETPEEQREFLENETAQGNLKHIIFDVVKRCPHCHSINVNFRQVCPHCLSPAIKARPVNGTSAQQPYPRKEWVCLQCNHVFSESKFYGRCLTCGTHFEEAKAESVVVYSYTLNTAENRLVGSQKKAPSELERALTDSELDFEPEEALAPLIRYEMRRCRASNSSFSVLVLQFDNLKALISLDGAVAARRRLRNALLLVGKVLSAGDQVIAGGANRLWILMPDTSRTTAHMVQGQLENYMKRLNLGLGISTALLAFPESFQTQEELLRKVELSLQATSSSHQKMSKTLAR